VGGGWLGFWWGGGGGLVVGFLFAVGGVFCFGCSVFWCVLLGFCCVGFFLGVGCGKKETPTGPHLLKLTRTGWQKRPRICEQKPLIQN